MKVETTQEDKQVRIKILLNYTMEDLKDYLNFEGGELLKTIGFSDTDTF